MRLGFVRWRAEQRSLIAKLNQDRLLTSRPTARLRQVGALCWQQDGDNLRVLLVTSRDTGRWVIPKGNRMAGRSDWDAAAQEAVEEAGVQGAISSVPLGAYAYEKRLKAGQKHPAVVVVYPLEVLIQLGAWPEGDERKRRWMSLSEAVSCVAEVELKTLLVRFDEDASR